MINKDTRKQERNFILFYFLSYVCFGTVMSNFTPFLSQLGYDPMQRGVLLSAYAITTILFQLLFGILADRYQTMKKIIIASITIFAIGSALLFYQEGMFFSLHLLVIALSGGLLNTLCGLYDTWVLSTTQELANRLSFIKAFGSVGWALGSVIASYVIMLFSYRGLAISICIIMLLALWNIKMIPDIKQMEQKKKTSMKDVASLLHDHTYMLLVFILFLMYAMIVANNCTVIDKMLALGANQTDISMKWSIQSLLEIPTYIAGVRILRRFRHTTLLQFSAVMLVLQFLLFAISDSISFMIFLSVFQLFSTPLLMITSKTLIRQIARPELRGSSQLVALSLFTGCSSFVVPAIAGSLSVSIGINTTLYVISILGLLALGLLQYMKKSIRFQI